MTKAQKTNTIKMTQEAYDELVQELEMRKTTERERIAKAIADARELGDLSENHAYTIAMEDKDLNEARIADLEELIKNVEIVTAEDTPSSIVSIGNTVSIKNLATSQLKKVQIVGGQETEAADPEAGKISSDSPIGAAIMNKRVGDIVEVSLPTGTIKYRVEKIA